MDYLEFVKIVNINLCHKYFRCYAMTFLRKVMSCCHGNVNLKNKNSLIFVFLIHLIQVLIIHNLSHLLTCTVLFPLFVF